MSKTIARKAIPVLEQAREQIAQNNWDYICHAIGDSTHDKALRNRLRERVESAIYPYHTMTRWAHANNLPTDDKSLRAMRLRWLDTWIAAIKKEYQL